jgi:cell division protein FtsB
MEKRTITVVLLGLLLVLQAQLWFGRGSIPDVSQMRLRLDAAKAQNLTAQAENDRLAAEVRDLKEGLEMVEEKARAELGMVRPNEILVQVTRR